MLQSVCGMDDALIARRKVSVAVAFEYLSSRSISVADESDRLNVLDQPE